MLNLRKDARDIFAEAVHAVDSREIVASSVRFDGSHLRIFGDEYDVERRQIYVVAIGKASVGMAIGLSEVLGERIDAGLITAPLGDGNPIILPHDQQRYSVLTTGSPGKAIVLPLSAASARRWRACSGGHPLPNMQSLKAGWQSLRLLKQANHQRALIIFLVSGGGSAMIEWPRREQITLEDLQTTNQLLITSGASIAEINSVRRAFSAIKGGGLAAAAPDSDQITLLVSDTNPGDEADIASGPTIESPIDRAAVQGIIEHYHLGDRLPESIAHTIGTAQDEHPKPCGIRKQYVLLDNRTALHAAAARASELGYTVAIAEDVVEQPIDRGSRQLIERIVKLVDEQHARDPVCLLSGGEFACPVRGNGVGGRNLETVLRCALQISQRRTSPWRHVAVLSAGTDGIDGNSPAAGGIADETTVERAHELKLDPQQFLDNSDSFRFLQILDSAIFTGPTGTNVRDVRVLAERAELATRMENTMVAPYGVAGGSAGRTGRIVLNPDTPGERVLPPLGDGIVLKRGDLLRFETCGGGGWGDPLAREPERVRQDVARGFVTARGALTFTGPQMVSVCSA